MKIIIFIFAVCFVGALAELTEEQKAELREYRTACVNETGVDEAKVDTAKTGDWKVDDVNLRCFVSCMLKKIKFLNEDETLNEDLTRKKIADHVTADVIDAVMIKCKDLRGADICETAMLMMKCFHEVESSITRTENSD